MVSIVYFKNEQLLFCFMLELCDTVKSNSGFIFVSSVCALLDIDDTFESNVVYVSGVGGIASTKVWMLFAIWAT